jgi:hypothetical protein
MTWDIGESLPQSSSSAWNIAPVCFVDQSLAPWEGGGGGWGRDNGRQGNSPPFGSGGGGASGSGASGSGNLKGSRVNNLNSGIGHNNNNNNNNKPHLSSSNNNNNNREGGASLESLVHAARGVVVEGEKGTILTTISNDRLMLASLSAAVE